ncbi:hypothetical protein CPC08DRAFT_714053 [Agrocybe pediades]|nr:hypothetical protein CPC08DRAFT_714053 [Agrocybe pediades]
MEKEQMRMQGDFELEDLTMHMSMAMPAPMQIPVQSNPQLPYPIREPRLCLPSPTFLCSSSQRMVRYSRSYQQHRPSTIRHLPFSPRQSHKLHLKIYTGQQRFRAIHEQYFLLPPIHTHQRGVPNHTFRTNPTGRANAVLRILQSSNADHPAILLGPQKSIIRPPLLMGRHSWLFDMPPPGLGGSDDSTQLPLPNFSTFDLAATMGNNDAAGLMERDPSPLPEVQSGLFGDFSFGVPSSSACSSMSRKSVSSTSEVEAVPLHQRLSKLDTSIPPWLSSLTDASSATPSSTGSSPSSSAGSPAPSVTDVLPEVSTMDMRSVAATPANTDAEENFSMSNYMNLDGLYAPDSMEGMFDEAVGAGGMGYEMYSGYEDPVVYSSKHSSQSQGLFEMASA